MSFTTDQIENQAESHRAHISNLIDELRNRVTPGEVIDQFLGWDEGREVARNFGRQVTNNPLPLALIGTGVAWLMFSDGSQRNNSQVNYRTPETEYRTGSGAMESVKSGARAAAGAVSSAADYASSAADSIGTTVGDTGAKLSSAAGSALDTAKQTVSDISSSAKSAYVQAKDSVSAAKDTASSVWNKTSGLTQSATETVRQTGINLGRMAEEQPLLVAGLGFALGMALGALFPTTEMENSLVGEQSDAVKEKAGELAGEGYEKAKAVAQKSYEAATEAAKQEATNQGLTPEEAVSAEYSPPQESSSADEALPYGSNDGGKPGSGAYGHH